MWVWLQEGTLMDALWSTTRETNNKNLKLLKLQTRREFDTPPELPSISGQVLSEINLAHKRSTYLLHWTLLVPENSQIELLRCDLKSSIPNWRACQIFGAVNNTNKDTHTNGNSATLHLDPAFFFGLHRSYQLPNGAEGDGLEMVQSLIWRRNHLSGIQNQINRVWRNQ